MRRLVCLLVFALWIVPVAAGQGGPYASAEALLDAIEANERSIKKLSAQILYERVYGLVGDIQTRTGWIYFDDARDDGGKRSFAIRFEKLLLDDVERDEEKLYLFDGEWVTEVLPESKQYFRRQVAPPGEEFDPLSLDSGTLPIPIGQAKADILAKYDVEMLGQMDGLAMPNPKLLAKSATQIRLTPRADLEDPGEFDEIRLWYTDLGGVPVPIIAKTINRQGDESTVLLVGPRLNEKASIPAGVFESKPPAGYDVQETPWRDAKGAFGPGDDLERTAFAACIAQPDRQPGLIESDPAELFAEEMPTGEAEVPPLAPAVARLLEAPYLSEDEAKDLRVFHGHWTEADLDTPSRRARAALTLGDYADEIFDDDATPPLLRAEALLERGAFDEVLRLTGGVPSIRARWLRAEAAFRLGDRELLENELSAVVARLAGEQVTEPDELVAGVRALMLRARTTGQDRGDGSDFSTLLTLLARVRNDLDRLYWPANLAEAELLYDKDNRKGAYDAAKEVLRLNPASAQAWALFGRMAVDRLAMDEADQIATRLELLAARPAPSWTAEGGVERIEPSALGAEVRALARLRQNDPEAAKDRLERARAILPERDELRALLAASYAMLYDLDAVDGLLDGFESTAAGHFWVGWALAERRQYPSAAKYLEKATEIEPDWPRPWIQLGLLETQAGRDVRALDALEKAFALDPFNVRADNTLRLLRELAEWETIETEHFVIRYREGVDGLLASEMGPMLERVHARVTGDEKNGMGHEPGFKTVLELMPDHQSFAVRIVGMPSLHTVAAATGPVIAMEAPRESPKHTIGPYDWLRVFQHEFTHTVTLDRTAFRIPLWFTEAAAQLMEDAPRDERTCRLLAEALVSGGLFEFDEINIKFARPEGPRERELAYAQGLWMYEFIIDEYGPAKPIELMDSYAAGEREVEAFERVLGVTRDEFRSAFEAWARAEAIAWGLVLEEDMPSVAELAERDGVGRAPSAEQIEAWLNEFPDHPELLELACSVIQGTPSAGEAELLEAYAAAVPVAEQPRKLLVRYALDGGGPRENAIEHLEFLDARAKYTPAYAAALAEQYVAAGDFERASDKAGRATIIAPYDPSQRDIAARVALSAKDYEAALRQLEALEILEPDRPIHGRRIEALKKLMGRGTGEI